MAFKRCDVVGCPNVSIHEGMCCAHGMTWLLSEGSDKAPGRDERRRAYVARMSLRSMGRTNEA